VSDTPSITFDEVYVDTVHREIGSSEIAASGWEAGGQRKLSIQLGSGMLMPIVTEPGAKLRITVEVVS
jgi:hypothetical protein